VCSSDLGESLVNETTDLLKISHETVGAMNEMAEGVNQINIAINQINDMSAQNKSNINALDQEMEKFSVSS
jgi:methyl-accepting chemotaxis protein